MQTRTKIFGMPLIALGVNERGFISIGAYARGVIAIGWVGRGFITIAQFGYGAIAFTQFGFGIVSVSQFGFGVLSIAQFGLGLVFAMGQSALGFIANGYTAKGYYAMSGPGVFNRLPGLLSQVAADPVPLAIWSGLWAVILMFLWNQRDKFTIGMSLADLFRSRRKNRVDRIRAKAVSRITDQIELLNIVLNDPSGMVKMAALVNITDAATLAKIAVATTNADVAGFAVGRIEDREALYDIARTAAITASKTGAVGRLIKKEPDQARLVELACVEGDYQVIQQIINAVKDRVSLETIIRKAASPHAKIAALYSIDNPDREFLMSIIDTVKDISVSEAAMLRITDQSTLAGIVTGGYQPAVKKAAVECISDKNLLAELAGKDIPEIVRKAIENRMNDIRPHYYSLKIEFSCPFCSQPVFVNGPVRNVKCRACLRESAVTGDLWKGMAGAGIGMTRFTAPLSLIVEKTNRAPACSACGSPLAADDIRTGETAMPPCPSCGSPQSTFPVPKWLSWSPNAEQVFCAEQEGVPSPAEKDIKPVAISCIKCGAPLEITAKTPRNATCTYCNTTQYLPDQLWLSLHPITIKQAWYIRCNFHERNR